jgi:putative ABC transport system permease protein
LKRKLLTGSGSRPADCYLYRDMSLLPRDLRFAVRHLRQTPAFSLTVILMLALGLGATTAIFSLVEGILLRPLPFKDADRLVLLGDHLGNSASIGVTAAEIATYAHATSAFSSMGAHAPARFELSGDTTFAGAPAEISARRLAASVFPTLGVSPLLGRVFTQQEESAGEPVTVISYGLWLNRYHLDPKILGTTIVLDRKPYSIIGVMPRSFEFPLEAGSLDQAQLWVPLNLTAHELDPESGLWGYSIVARLKPGVTLPQAAQDTDRVARDIMRNFPASKSSLRIRGDVKLLREQAVSEVRPLLRTMFLSVSVVLLIACVNVASLLLVRAIRLRRQYAVRLALGARSGAILRECVLEGVLLSFAGGVLGLGFAAIAIRTALHLLPESLPRISSIHMDAGVVAFGFGLALLTGALCSVAPAFAALRTNLTDSLKEGARTEVGSSSHAGLRSALVVAEIAIALVLLTVSGAFLRSFQKMRAVDPGFRPAHVLVGAYELPKKQYTTNDAVDAFDQAVVERLSAKPGIVAASITTTLPTEYYGASSYTIEGEPASTWKLKFALFTSTYGDYFRTMDIPLLEGRTFTLHDRADSPLVVIVNESMAKQSWPGQSAIGKRMHSGNPHKPLPWATVVGVVADTKVGGRDEPDKEQWYIPALQPATLNGSDPTETLTLPTRGYVALRSTLPPEQMAEVLRATVAQVDPWLALEQVQPLTEVLADTEAPRRFNTSLITSFALGALLLAFTGIYAVVSFSASLRTQEIAIRVALGAPRSSIARLVLVSGARIAFLGCVLGVLGALATSRLVSDLLFDVTATDPLVYSLAALTMFLLSLLACALPAARAAAADPVDALRAH